MNKLIVLLPAIASLLHSPDCHSQKIALPKQAAVDALMSEYHVPTVGVSIIENGKLKKAHVFGRLPSHAHAPLNTFFNIASLTKPITSTTTLILVSQGQWDLDEPLFHYWVDPDVASDEKHKMLTTRHVLSHRSGLSNWRGHDPGGKLAFAFEPGTQWKYSGEGFEYLRQALEHKFHIPFEKLVDSLLFKPLKMNDTEFFWTPSRDASLFANAHHEDGTPYEPETWGDANPSNRVLTTVTDYAKFGIGVMKSYGVTPAIYKQMITNQAKLDNNREWGLGWRLINNLSNGEYAIMHTGGNPGISTVIILLPQSKRGIVVFTNGARGNELYERIVSESLDVGKEIINRMK